MLRRRSSSVLVASIALGVGLSALLSGCSGPDAATPSASASRSASASAGGRATPTDDQTGSQDDGTGPGTGNGSGADAPATIDWSAVTKQGVAAAGGGTVVSLAGSGDNWTVVVAGPDGSLTQSVVSASLGRVTSGPFPKDSDDATKSANASRASALRVDAATAAGTATGDAGDTLVSLDLGGTATDPVWSATVSSNGATRTVTVDGLTGATS